MKKFIPNKTIIISVIAMLVLITAGFVVSGILNNPASIEVMQQKIENKQAQLYNEVPIFDKSNNIQVLRTFLPDEFNVESNVRWTLNSDEYPAEIDFKAVSSDGDSELAFIYTKEYMQKTDKNVFGEILYNSNIKDYQTAEEYLMDRVKEMNPDASNIEIIQKDKFTDEEISKMKQVVTVDAKNIDLVLSPDEDAECDEHAGYVKITDITVDPATITYQFEQNGKKYNQKLSTIITSILVEHKDESQKTSQERLWTSSGVYGYKDSYDSFGKYDDSYRIMIANTEVDQRWITALSGIRQELYMGEVYDGKTKEELIEIAPDAIRKIYFSKEEAFMPAPDFMSSLIRCWDFYVSDMIDYLYKSGSEISIPLKFSEVFKQNNNKIYVSIDSIKMPTNWEKLHKTR